MSLLPAFLLLAQGASAQTSPNARVEVPILHRRPSRISSILNELAGASRVMLYPDDRAGTLTLVGPTADIAEVRSRLSLLDNAPRRLRLAVQAESPIDHAAWKAEVELANNVAWSGSDDATGVRLRVTPRINDDGTCTLYVKAESSDASALSVVFRVKANESKEFTLPLVGPVPMAQTDRAPRFTLKYLGD